MEKSTISQIMDLFDQLETKLAEQGIDLDNPKTFPLMMPKDCLAIHKQINSLRKQLTSENTNRWPNR